MNTELGVFETTIRGFKVELEIFDDGGDIVSQSVVIHGDCCSSFTCLEAWGTLENDNTGEDIAFPNAPVNEIRDWLADNGY